MTRKKGALSLPTSGAGVLTSGLMSTSAHMFRYSDVRPTNEFGVITLTPLALKRMRYSGWS